MKDDLTTPVPSEASMAAMPFSAVDWHNAVWSAMRDLSQREPALVRPMNLHTIRTFCDASWEALKNSPGVPSDPRRAASSDTAALRESHALLVEALGELVRAHTDAAGMSADIVADKVKFRAFLDGCQQRVDAALTAARAALAAAEGLTK